MTPSLDRLPTLPSAHETITFTLPGANPVFQDHGGIIIIIVVVIIFIIELTHSKTVLENTTELEPQPVALDFKNFSQYSCHSR